MFRTNSRAGVRHFHERFRLAKRHVRRPCARRVEAHQMRPGAARFKLIGKRGERVGLVRLLDPRRQYIAELRQLGDPIAD